MKMRKKEQLDKFIKFITPKKQSTSKPAKKSISTIFNTLTRPITGMIQKLTASPKTPAKPKASAKPQSPAKPKASATPKATPKPKPKSKGKRR